jgi:hypothetical protein
MNKLEQEKLRDFAMLVRSAKKLLAQLNPGNLRGFDEIRRCFESAEKAIKGALGQAEV